MRFKVLLQGESQQFTMHGPRDDLRLCSNCSTTQLFDLRVSAIGYTFLTFSIYNPVQSLCFAI